MMDARQLCRNSTTTSTTTLVKPGEFDPQKHFYERVLNAQIHPLVRFFLTLGNERIAERYCHLHPEADPAAVRDDPKTQLQELLQAQQAAQSIIETAINDVTMLRGRLGAFERNVLETSVRSMQSQYENLTSSESQIRDADFATETERRPMSTLAFTLEPAGVSLAPGCTAYLPLDAIIVAILGGGITALLRRRAATAALAFAFALASINCVPSPSYAQTPKAPAKAAPAAPSKSNPANDDFAIKAVSQTRLAYVLTGNSDVDSIVKAGLSGLTLFLAQRTALEAGEPVGVDPALGATSQVIGLVTSRDGVTFSAPRLALAPDRARLPRAAGWVGYSTPQPVVIDGVVHLFTDVASDAPDPRFLESWLQVALAHASSVDGVTGWKADPTFFQVRGAPAWTTREVRSVTPVLDGNVLRLWWAGDQLYQLVDGQPQWDVRQWGIGASTCLLQ